MLPIKNKGMFLEKILNQTHEKYRDQNLCLVSKIPTNFKINNQRTNNQLVFDQNFNCDYIGCYQGHYFEFEAKETNLDSFSYQNLRQNQTKKLNLVIEQKGISFLIIYFSKFDRYFFVDWKQYFDFAVNHKKTIPLEWFVQNCDELFINNQLMLDYLNSLNYQANCI